MSGRSSSPKCIEVTLGDGTMSPTVEMLPLAEARDATGALKSGHELVRLARAQFDRRHPRPARLGQSSA